MKQLLVILLLTSTQAISSELDDKSLTPKEFSENITATVIGFCEGLNLKTFDEKADCLSNGFYMAKSAFDKQAESNQSSK